MGSIDARNCIDDAIARINDMLNVDNASRMGGAGSDYDRGVIDGLKKSLELMSQEESIDFGPGKILRKIEELEKGNVLDQPAPEAHGGT